MSNRRRPRGGPRSVDWLLCPDCASTVHEVFRGTPPHAVLSIEVQHSDTCPAWRSDGNEVALMFVPNQVEDS